MPNDQHQATARAHPNIAFIKYWGNSDDDLRIPISPSISMNLNELYTETTVIWDRALRSDQLILNGQMESGTSLDRVKRHLDVMRRRLEIQHCALVTTTNNFPMGAGIASSASSFAALTVAGLKAVDVGISERELTTIARIGSGSAARSIPPGFVEWHTGSSHETSFAQSFALPDYWDLVDVIAVLSGGHKAVGSTQGHQSAHTSDLQAARVKGAPRRFDVCKQAILDRDFDTFAEIVELDSNLMHAVMMTSRPPLFYWLPASLTVMESVRKWRGDGLQVCYTLDAGPNVHCICVRKNVPDVSKALQRISAIKEIRVAGVGEGAQVVSNKE
jgi:diphosphomevalonate decarboxylase